MAYKDPNRRKEYTKAYYQANKEANKARVKAYSKAYYQEHKDKIKERCKAYRQVHKEQRKASAKEWYEAHKEQQNASAKAYYEAHKEQRKASAKAYYEAHKEQQNASVKAWKEAHKEDCNAYMKSYMKSDLNANGETKQSIRQKSMRYLSKYGKKIPGYQIHHCCSYSEPYKFIYCSREMHHLIHSYLRQHNIDADSEHYAQIKHLLDDTVVKYNLE